MQVTKIMFLGVLFLGGAFQARAADRYHVQVPAVYEAENSARQGLKDECKIDSLLGNYVLQSVSERFPGSLPLSADPVPAGDYLLKLTVVYAFGHGGGGNSGSKILTIRADLFQDGKMLRSLVKRENSRMGSFGFLSGTCSIFDRLAGRMGKHVVKWLVMPASVKADNVMPAENGELEAPEASESKK
ncbi:MAG: hypothetical protein ACM3SV_06150 [Betaproteobacteria bacterium]